MDKVYDDFKFVWQIFVKTMEHNCSTGILPQPSFHGSCCLKEHLSSYHGLDATRAKKYLEFAVEAAQIVINSNK
jgi:hypothetical protein